MGSKIKNAKAIELLTIQRDEVKKLNPGNEKAWLVQTSAFVKEIFGDQSTEFSVISKHHFTIVRGDDHNYIWHSDTELPNMECFLDNCIEKVRHFGVAPQTDTNLKKPYYQKYDKGTTVAIIIFLLGLGYGAGHIIGFNASNYELRERIRELNDSLSTKRSDFTSADYISNKTSAKDSATKQKVDGVR